jgi:hypothetical protein
MVMKVTSIISNVDLERGFCNRRFDYYAAVKLQLMLIWIVAICSVVAGAFRKDGDYLYLNTTG